MNIKKAIDHHIQNILSDRSLSKEEEIESELFLNAFKHNPRIDECLQEEWDNPQETDETFSFDPIHEKTRFVQATSIFKTIFFKAGVILLLCSSGLAAFWDLQNPNGGESYADTGLDVTEDKLTEVCLVTEGETFDLSKDVVQFEKNGFAVKGTNKGLHIESTEGVQVEKVRHPIWNTLYVPKKRDYYTKLSDGTEVWVNADSEFKFPDFFDKKRRIVHLDGEAYFNVKSDSDHPFIIKTKTEDIRVTGTQFNVCAYQEEENSYITLEEGKVSVFTQTQEYTLKPGEQLTRDSFGKVSQKEVDVDLYTSWRNGVYIFQDLSFQEIAFRLNKWYDIDFEYTDSRIAQMHFSGMTKKEYKLDYFLAILEQTTNIEFKIDNKKVVVSISN